MLIKLFNARILCACLCVCTALAFAATPVRAAIDDAMGPNVPSRDDAILMVTLGKAEIVTVPGEISDILVADPKIADVVALQSDKLYIVGASIGETNIIATDRNGSVIRRMNVSVKVDTVAIEDMVHTLFPNEKNVKIHMIGDQLALTGLVSTPSAAQKITRLVAAHMGEIQDKDVKDVDELIENLLEVRGEQQVMLRVRMLEMSRNVLKELGLEPNANRYLPNANTTATNGNGLTGFLGTTARTGLTQDPFGIGSLILDTGLAGIGELEILLNALQRDNLANMLAEPNLTSVSGEQAGFLAGGEFPVPVGRDRDGNIVVDYKEFGVSLNFKPTVLSEDRISLQLNTEVSSLDPASGITLAEINIPGLDVRRASTTVEINSGGTLMMAGLLRSETVKGLAGIPGIRDTPVVGDLLSSDSFNREETELVVLVTPYLVQPFADNNQAVPVMNEHDLMDLPPPPPPAGLMPEGKEKEKPLQKSDLMPGRVVTAPRSEHAEAPKSLSPNSPLSKAFSKNMKDVYGDKAKTAAPAQQKQSYGYMLE